MMYPYITLVDGTEITHSHIIDRDGLKTVEVHFERAKEGGFDAARCILPSYRWTFRDGFTDDEMTFFNEFLRHNSHLLFKHAMTKDVSQIEILKDALLRFDPSLSDKAADSVVADICENVDFSSPNIARHDLQWIAENFYKSHYLHAPWNDVEEE